MGSEIDYTAPLDATTLIVEVASGAFCFKSKIKAAQIKTLWEKLSEFVAGLCWMCAPCLLVNSMGWCACRPPHAALVYTHP